MHLNCFHGDPKIFDQDHGSSMAGSMSLRHAFRTRENPRRIRRNVKSATDGIIRSNDIRPALAVGIRAFGGTSGARIGLMRKFMTKDKRPGIRGHIS